MKKIIVSIIVLVSISLGCKKNSTVDPTEQQMPDTTKLVKQLPETGNTSQDSVLYEFKDFDSNVYHAIQIGRQIWSKENLKTTHYNDGTPIPCVPGTSEWAALKSGAYCHYNNDAFNSNINGLLYNYYAVTSNKLAPKGWHVATYEDWNTLLAGLGIKYLLGDVGSLVDAKNWSKPFYACSRDGSGNIYYWVVTCTNGTGFTALPNGYRENSISPGHPEFDCLGYQASWWVSYKLNSAKMIFLDESFGVFSRDDIPMCAGSGIRLVKD